MAVNLYWIVQADATATPTNVQIKDGQDGTGAAALKSGSEAYTAAGTYDEATAITGLSAGTAYEQCWVAWDGATYSNVVTTTITTAAAHATSGALAAEAGAIGGTAAHLTLHATSGALAAQDGAIAGTATHVAVHASSGALAAQDAAIAGDASHTAPGVHASSGTLEAQDSTVAGTATHLLLHATTGALEAQSASLAGTALHNSVHATSGALQASDAALSGSASGPAVAQAAAAPVAGGWPEHVRGKKTKLRREPEPPTPDEVRAQREAMGIVEPKASPTKRPILHKPDKRAPIPATVEVPRGIAGRDLALWIELLNDDILHAGGEDVPDVRPLIIARGIAQQRQEEEDMAVVLATIVAAM
ncbi:MAG: hypothetical protein RJA55_1458 [Acidobacteriota bacterium]|jgi:hypothetical protein